MSRKGFDSLGERQTMATKATFKDIAQDNQMEATAVRTAIQAESARQRETMTNIVGRAILAVYVVYLHVKSNLTEMYPGSSPWSIAEVTTRALRTKYSASMLRACEALSKGGLTQLATVEKVSHLEVEDIAASAENLGEAHRIIGTLKHRGMIDGETLRKYFAFIRAQFIGEDGLPKTVPSAQKVTGDTLRALLAEYGYAVSFTGAAALKEAVRRIEGTEATEDGQTVWAFPDLTIAAIAEVFPSVVRIAEVGSGAAAD